MNNFFMMKINISLYALFFAFTLFANTNQSNTPLQIQQLRVEYLENPKGIDITTPRFSWVLNGDGYNRMQSAYKITVSSSKDFTQDSNVWNSGKIVSNQSNLL